MYVQGLKLISLGFEKKFSMNMTFLTDQYDEDFLEDIINVTSEKLQHESCDIRCSALEVIALMSQNVNESK